MIDFKRALNNKWLKEFETAEITSLHGGQSGVYIYRVRLDYRSYLVKVTDKVALMPQLKEEVSLMAKLQGYDFVRKPIMLILMNRLHFQSENMSMVSHLTSGI